MSNGKQGTHKDDDESKEEEEVIGTSTESETAFPMRNTLLGKDADSTDGMLPQRPSRDNVVQLLRSLHHEQLVEMLTPIVQSDVETYTKLVHESETDVHKRKLFVHGLPARTTEDQFRKFFEQYGEVELVQLPHAKAHSEVKFGFVVFRTIPSLHAALEQPNKQFEGKEICCKVFTVRSGSMDSSPNSGSQPVTSHTNRKVFISGLAPTIGDAELYSYFSVCGEVEAAQVAQGRSTGFVLFTEPQGAKEAVLRLNKSFLAGRQISVVWYRKDEARPERRQVTATPQRVPSGAFPTTSHTTTFNPPTGWYNYHAYVQQDPFLLVSMPVYQPDFQSDNFFSNVDDVDRKQF